MRLDAETGSERGLYGSKMWAINTGLAALHLLMSDNNTSRIKLIIIYLNIRRCMMWCSVCWYHSVLLGGRSVFTTKLFALLRYC